MAGRRTGGEEGFCKGLKLLPGKAVKVREKRVFDNNEEERDEKR